MAAAIPTPTKRGIPPGQELGEGYQILVTFAANPNVLLWEISVQPPGINVGKSINKTSQFNNQVKTKGAPKLRELTDGSSTCKFNPKSYNDCMLLVGVETAVTITWPDKTMYCFFGYMEDFTPDSLENEKLPTAKYKLVVTNVDPATGLESPPVLYDEEGKIIALGTLP